MTSYTSVGETLAREHLTDKVAEASSQARSQAPWSDKYRGATVEDLDPPPALSVFPNDSILSAQLAAYERDYTHLTVISSNNRGLIGYLNIPRLKELLREGKVTESDPVRAAMQRFNRKPGNVYHVITMSTPLEDLERFFRGEAGPREGYPARRERQEFAIVTDDARKFVLGVVTQHDLEEFVKRRPA